MRICCVRFNGKGWFIGRTKWELHRSCDLSRRESFTNLSFGHLPGSDDNVRMSDSDTDVFRLEVLEPESAKSHSGSEMSSIASDIHDWRQVSCR